MEKRFKPFKQFKRQSGARKDCDQLLRVPLRSACSRLGSFFCAVPRRRVRLERAEKITGDRCYFVNGSKECSSVGFRWLVEAADLSRIVMRPHESLPPSPAVGS